MRATPRTGSPPRVSGSLPIVVGFGAETAPTNRMQAHSIAAISSHCSHAGMIQSSVVEDAL